MNVLITICARGGSKGLKGKNIKLLNGIPLIAYTIKQARSLSKLLPSKIVLSTDNSKIIETSSKHGLGTDYTRPDNLSKDNSGKIDAINHILQFEENKKKYDYVIDLDVTSPLRKVEEIVEAFDLIYKKSEALNLFSVSNPHRNPYFNMVELKSNGYVKLVKDIGPVLSRQEAPKVFDVNASFYIYRRKFFTDKWKTSITNKTLIYLMNHLCFDIDSIHDFDYLEFLVKQKKLPFDII